MRALFFLFSLVSLPAFAEPFVPVCACEPLGQSGRVALCVEKRPEVSPHGFDCEAAIYPNGDRCEAALEQLKQSGNCR